MNKLDEICLFKCSFNLIYIMRNITNRLVVRKSSTVPWRFCYWSIYRYYKRCIMNGTNPHLLFLLNFKLCIICTLEANFINI